ncbi:VOC family protein [Tabrizicola sp. BL-A-41-H6]|uniref:VOC family protein n=1 Tax=Tabrizicola sp. BL-A-41-H6 TaxID=3421107 RepID=UPI003D664BD3
MAQALVSGYHHLTLSTDGAQEDYDFYTKTLGLYSVKRTVLFDGTIPVYHLYYGSKHGDASTIITTFPFKKPGIYGRRGTNQSRTIMQSIPVGAADYWVDRLNARGIPATKGSRFGLTRVIFAHPCGIPHELVENPGDTRAPIVNPAAGTTAQTAIRGIYGAGVAVFDIDSMNEFVEGGVGLKLEANSDEGRMYSVPDNLGPHSVVEVIEDRASKQGTWMLAGGTIHHFALNTGTEENQVALKARLEGMGFTDVSEQKDRNYFKSMYVRSPGGALFEIAWTVPEGWAKDEAPDAIGQSLVFPPWFEDRRAELMQGLEAADF